MHNYIEVIAAIVLVSLFFFWEWWSTCDSSEEEEELIYAVIRAHRGSFLVYDEAAIKMYKEISRNRWKRKFFYRMRYQTYLKFVAGV